jgi:drug/metabolite transporter (DMT)-like permease
MKWAGMYFVGFVFLTGGVLAALWKLGILQHIETTWIAIGIAILVGIGIMVSVANSGAKENIQIDRK